MSEGIKSARLRVVPKEDVWNTLVNANTHVCHEGRDRTQAYFLEYMYHIPQEVTVIYLRLPVRQAKGESLYRKYFHKLSKGGGQADLVDLQLGPDNGYKFILNYQDYFHSVRFDNSMTCNSNH